MNGAPADLAYFTEWGGRSWKHLVAFAISELQKGDGLNGAELLDIGTRYGKMAVWFSLLGAKVTGIDLHEQYLSAAREEAKKWHVSNVEFIAYNGDLDFFPDASFDIVFTKSVLVTVPDLEGVLKKISNKLRPRGRVIFVENGQGNPLFHALRKMRHTTSERQGIQYFTNNEVKLIQSVFHIDAVRRNIFPPIYLLLGRKRL